MQLGALGTVGGIKGSEKLNRLAGDKTQKDDFEDKIRAVLNENEYKDVINNLRKKAKRMGVEVKDENDSFYNFNTDTISVDSDTSPSSLAHEMGHAAMSKKGRSKDIIGKAAHSKISAHCCWGKSKRRQFL